MRKGMSFSLAGKLGGQSTAKINRERSRQLQERYHANPKKCKTCNNALNYKQRRNRFCSQSCAAKLNNLGIRRHGSNPERKCLHCHAITTNPKFCNNTCQQKHRKEKVHNRIRQGKYKLTWSGNAVIKQFLVEERGSRCERCKNTHWQGEKIPLNVHHIDGDARNNIPSNLNLLCLNCHGLTKNFGSNNKHSTRAYRYKKAP